MDEKELRIMEIMDELSCDHDVAECMFLDEMCDKYETDDIDVAEAMLSFHNLWNLLCQSIENSSLFSYQ